MTREDDDEELYDCLEDRLDALLDAYDEFSEDLGSCDNCGCNLHDGDDLEQSLCDQCSWRESRGM